MTTTETTETTETAGTGDGTGDGTRTTGAPPPVEVAPQFPVLDTLRTVGALAVLTTHVTFQSGDYLGNGLWGTVFARLDVGVAVFFVLSGFLLSRPHLARAAMDRPGPPTGRYYWKRALRIYPVYAVSAVVALLVIDENSGFGPGRWLSSLLLLDTYTQTKLPQGLTQMWSLGVEVAFYAVLPLLMVAAVGRRRPALRPGRVGVVLASLVVVSVLWHGWLAGRLAGHVEGIPTSWLPAYLSWFAVGIGLALLHVRHQAGARGTRWVALLGAMPGTSWALAAGLLLVAATPVAGPTLLAVGTTGQGLTKNLLYALIGGLVVVTGVFADRTGRYHRVMATPFLRHLGHISYSVFCIHLVVLHLVWTTTGWPVFRGHGAQAWVLTLVVSLVAAELLYRLVEMPAMRLRSVRRNGRSVDQPTAPASATTTR